MWRSLSPLAVVAAALVAYVAPFAIIALVVAPLLGRIALSGVNGGAVLFVLWVLLATLGPLATGFVAARLSKAQPLLHGLLAGAVAALVAIQFTGFHGVVGGIILWSLGPPMLSVSTIGAITLALFLFGAVAGAWLFRKLSAYVAAA